MTREEAVAGLVAGAKNTDSVYLNVPREQLLIALGAKEEEQPADGSDEQAEV